MRLGTTNAGFGAITPRETAYGVAAPGLRRTAHRLRAAEKRVRIARYAALRDRQRAKAV